MIECPPAASEEVEKVAVPPLSAPVPNVVAPSLKVTVPAGPEEGVTVAVKETDWPTTLGLVPEATLVVVAVVPVAGMFRFQTPRPWVPANSRRLDSCNTKDKTATSGRPVTRVFQVVPPSLLFMTPTSVPM